MDKYMLVSLINDHVMKLQELSNNLAVGDERPLTKDEKSMAREVLNATWVPGVLDEMRVFFLVGNMREVKNATELITNTLKELN